MKEYKESELPEHLRLKEEDALRLKYLYRCGSCNQLHRTVYDIPERDCANRGSGCGGTAAQIGIIVPGRISE